MFIIITSSKKDDETNALRVDLTAEQTKLINEHLKTLSGDNPVAAIEIFEPANPETHRKGAVYPLVGVIDTKKMSIIDADKKLKDIPEAIRLIEKRSRVKKELEGLLDKSHKAQSTQWVDKLENLCEMIAGDTAKLTMSINSIIPQEEPLRGYHISSAIFDYISRYEETFNKQRLYLSNLNKERSKNGK